MSTQETHALIRRSLTPPRQQEATKPMYCTECGAQIRGKGAWGHDDDCLLKK